MYQKAHHHYGYISHDKMVLRWRPEVQLCLSVGQTDPGVESVEHQTKLERWGKVQKIKGNDESLPFWLTKPEKVFVVLHITHIFDTFPLLVIDRLVLGLRGDPGEEGVRLPTGCLGLRPG